MKSQIIIHFIVFAILSIVWAFDVSKRFVTFNKKCLIIEGMGISKGLVEIF